MACDSILFVDTMEDHMPWNDITQILLKQALRTRTHRVIQHCSLQRQLTD